MSNIPKACYVHTTLRCSSFDAAAFNEDGMLRDERLKAQCTSFVRRYGAPCQPCTIMKVLQRRRLVGIYPGLFRIAMYFCPNRQAPVGKLNKGMRMIRAKIG